MLADVDQMIQKAESEPQNFAAQMRTGDMYAQIGKFDKAVEFYKRGLLLKPDDFNANVVLLTRFSIRRNLKKLPTIIQRPLKINGNDVNARTDLGTTFVERPSPGLRAGDQESFKAALRSTQT